MAMRDERSRSPSILNLGAGDSDDNIDNRGAAPKVDKLQSFRERFPVDDRAFDFLQKAPEAVQDVVLSDFKPRSEGQKDYSALLTIFVRKVLGRCAGGATSQARGKEDHHNYEAPDRRGAGNAASRSRGREVVRRRVRTRKRRTAAGSSPGRNSDGALSEAFALGSGSSISASLLGSGSEYSSDEDVLSSSGSSTSSSISANSAVEDEARRAAHEKRDRILGDAVSEEVRRINQAEDDAEKNAVAELRRGREAIEDEFERKLASYRETLLQEKDDKVKQLKMRVEMQRVDHIKREKEAALVERERQERRAEMLVEESLQTIMAEKRRDRNNMRLQKELKRMEDKKAKEGKQKGRPKKVKRKIRIKEKVKDKEKKAAHHGDKARRRRKHRGHSRSGSSKSRKRHHRKKDSDRRRDREADGGRDRRGSSAHNPELDAFRERYPMDSRAFSILAAANGEVQRTVLTRFKPRSEGDDDYSALVMSFLRSIQMRMATPGPGGGAPSKVWRDARHGDCSEERSPHRGRSADPARKRDDRPVPQGRSASRSRSRSPGRERALNEFRMRYPMDERAFGNFQLAPSSVQDVVMSDFKPRREGEEDYSALVMAFVRAVQARAAPRR
mmetsp:Transcript_13379/g.31396  ORF Transcript_13379/g.31396 Transcript_13379/m.31396 type:complete len:616 (-) Transcript_13379:145-1992(-)